MSDGDGSSPPLQANGAAKPRAAVQDGVAIHEIEETKYNKYPELVGSRRCRLMVLAGEIGGRWSDTCCKLVRDLVE